MDDVEVTVERGPSFFWPHLVVTFEYARSGQGVPRFDLAISLQLIDQLGPATLAFFQSLVADAVTTFEEIGSDHHGRQAMPSLDVADYALAWMRRAEPAPLVTGSDLDAAGVGDLRRQLERFGSLDLELLYVGEWGSYQEVQAREFGGATGVERAHYRWMVGRDVLAGTYLPPLANRAFYEDRSIDREQDAHNY